MSSFNSSFTESLEFAQNTMRSQKGEEDTDTQSSNGRDELVVREKKLGRWKEDGQMPLASQGTVFWLLIESSDLIHSIGLNCKLPEDLPYPYCFPCPLTLNLWLHIGITWKLLNNYRQYPRPSIGIF